MDGAEPDLPLANPRPARVRGGKLPVANGAIELVQRL